MKYHQQLTIHSFVDGTNGDDNNNDNQPLNVFLTDRIISVGKYLPPCNRGT